MKIQVINPNTCVSMTQDIAKAARSVARSGVEIIASNPECGPYTIEGHFDEAIAAVGVLEEVKKGVTQNYDAHIIACFGDPGLLAAREIAKGPVIGIAEAAFHYASLLATKFAVVTTLRRTCIIAEHLLDRYGFSHICTSVECIDLPVAELETGGDRIINMISEESIKVRDAKGAGAIVLGCGGMAPYVAEISQRIGIPVIDGVSAAVKLAEGLVDLGLATSKKGDLDFPLPKPFTGKFAPWGSQA